MRGYPIWQVLCVVFMFAAVGLPVWRLTSPTPLPADVAAPAPVGPAAAETTLDVQVNFAPAPADFALRSSGETVVLAGQGPAADFSGKWTAKLPADGADLTLQARWPETSTGHVAAHVTIRFPDGRETAETFWRDAGQTLVETLTVKP